jgi:predicted transcriptional regulator
MAKRKELTPQIIIDALQKANGLQAGAARQLGVTRQTISNHIKNDPIISEAYEAVNETTIDFVESKLMENIRNGNVVAQIFYLKTKAKHRGYVERQELTGKDGGGLNVIQIMEHKGEA